MARTTRQSASPVLVRSGNATTLQDATLSLITLPADAGDTGGALTTNKATPSRSRPIVEFRGPSIPS